MTRKASIVGIMEKKMMVADVIQQLMKGSCIQAIGKSVSVLMLMTFCSLSVCFPKVKKKEGMKTHFCALTLRVTEE